MQHPKGKSTDIWAPAPPPAGSQCPRLPRPPCNLWSLEPCHVMSLEFGSVGMCCGHKSLRARSRQGPKETERCFALLPPGRWHRLVALVMSTPETLGLSDAHGPWLRPCVEDGVSHPLVVLSGGSSPWCLEWSGRRCWAPCLPDGTAGSLGVRRLARETRGLLQR